MAYRAPAPRSCNARGSVSAELATATDSAGEGGALNTVAGRERVGEREKGGGRGIKYGIVGIEYVIEITWVREKWI